MPLTEIGSAAEAERLKPNAIASAANKQRTLGMTTVGARSSKGGKPSSLFGNRVVFNAWASPEINTPTDKHKGAPDKIHLNINSKLKLTIYDRKFGNFAAADFAPKAKNSNILSHLCYSVSIDGQPFAFACKVTK
jgi:hypothetical protein